MGAQVDVIAVLTQCIADSEVRTRMYADTLRNAKAVVGDLLSWVEVEYITLADPRNEWPGRYTLDGQRRLCELRDLIARATGRDEQDVHDDYGNRATARRASALAAVGGNGHG